MVLNNPAFTKYVVEYGEISSYPAGYKENAGIFCHNNPWVIIGETVIGRGDRAWDYFRKICPSYTEENSALHKVDSPFELIERSEYRADKWVAEHFLTQEDFREAFQGGCRELWQLAEYFDMPESEVQKALTYWTERKGVDFSKE